MTRIVVYAHRYKRPPPKKAKAGPPKPVPPTIVVGIGEKRMKRLRAERRAAEPREPSPEIEAFFARNVRPALPPKR